MLEISEVDCYDIDMTHTPESISLHLSGTQANRIVLSVLPGSCEHQDVHLCCGFVPEWCSASCARLPLRVLRILPGGTEFPLSGPACHACPGIVVGVVCIAVGHS